MDFTWFALDCNIWTNPKVAKLAGMLKTDIDTAVCKIARIWSWAMLSESEDGEITHIPDYELAGIARWRKSPSTFLAALEECGFVDEVDGRKFLHEWDCTNGKYPRKRRADRDRKAAGNSTEIPRNNDGKMRDTVTYTKTIDITSPIVPPTGDEPEKPRELKSTLSKEQEARFRRFWTIYPRREKPEAARRAWAKIKPDEALTGEIVAGVKRSIEKDGRFRDGYIPHPSTWLNGQEWLNEYSEDRLPRAASPPKRPGAAGNHSQRKYTDSELAKCGIDLLEDV